MIAEAIDTAITLGWALAAWIAVLALAAALALHTVLAIVWWAGRAAWRAFRRTQRDTRPPSAKLPIPVPIASRRRPQPSWALPRDLDALSASPSPESEKEHIA